MHREHNPDQHEQDPGTAPRIWIGLLSDYNDGVLFGEWLDAARDAEAVQTDIQTMLARSPTAARTGQPAEEWGIFDHDGFGPLTLGEYADLDYVTTVARGIAEHGPSFAAYAAINDPTDLASYADDYIGQWPSTEAYVEQMADDCELLRLLDHALPESIRPYVRLDTAALARDMELGGDITPVPDGQGGYWLFHNH